MTENMVNSGAVEMMSDPNVGNRTRERRAPDTVLGNKFGITATSAIQRLTGSHNGINFMLESFVNTESSNDIKSFTRLELDVKHLYDAATNYDFVEKLTAKIGNKFAKIPNVEFRDGVLVIVNENKQFITEPKVAIKQLKSIGKYVKHITSITEYVNKMVARKEQIAKNRAEKKAAKAAAKKAAAEAIPGATEVIADSPVTGLL